MKTIYILLSKTGTIPARVIRKFNNGSFSHTSISLVPETNCFYSFGRRKLHNILIAGFITEDIHTCVYGKYPNAFCGLYSLDVSDKTYEIISDEITNCKNNYKRSKYNFLGWLSLAFGLKLKRKHKFTCSQFVAHVISKSGEIKLPKDPWLMMPGDFPSIEGIKLVYEGPIKNCKASTSFTNS